MTRQGQDAAFEAWLQDPDVKFAISLIPPSPGLTLRTLLYAAFVRGGLAATKEIADMLATDDRRSQP